MPHITFTPKRRRDGTKSKFKVMGNHNEFLSRIKKTLYYGKLPVTERFSLPVAELAAELFSEVKSGRSLERLDLEEAAVMSKNACVSPCSLVLALLYLERLKTCNPDYLQRVAPSELFLVSMMVASKFLHDDGEPDEVFNDEWAESAGLSVKNINRFEREFLQAIEWEVFVGEQAFWTRLCGMEKAIALKEGKRRGWFTYTDLENLLDTVDFTSLAQTVLTVSAVCLTSYTASVLTIIGSAFIVSQIPGTPMSSSVSSSTCNVPATHLQDTPISNSSDQPSFRVSPSVDVLTTSFILASLSSCSSGNMSDMSDCSSVASDCRRGTTYFPELYQVNRSATMSCGLKSTLWSELAKYLGWHWWKFEREHLLPGYSEHHDAKVMTQSPSGEHRELDDVSNKSERGVHSEQVTQGKDNADAQGDSQDWIKEIRNWLDETVLEKSSQMKFFPLEISTSNY